MAHTGGDGAEHQSGADAPEQTRFVGALVGLCLLKNAWTGMVSRWPMSSTAVAFTIFMVAYFVQSPFLQKLISSIVE
jgi:hypothetical protein